MRLLYIFAHPDDESFGCSLAMLQQLADGHEVHLFTLTRGEGSSERERLGVDTAELGRMRTRELEAAAEQLGLSSLRIADFPDGRLVDEDPRPIEAAIGARLKAVDPQVVVTFPAHGLNGHGDHCVAHATCTRAWCDWRERVGGPRRLAFIGIAEDAAERRPVPMHPLREVEIDCRIQVDEATEAIARRALACHRSQLPIIERHRPLDLLRGAMVFRCFGEHHQPPLTELTAALR